MRRRLAAQGVAFDIGGAARCPSFDKLRNASKLRNISSAKNKQIKKNEIYLDKYLKKSRLSFVDGKVVDTTTSLLEYLSIVFSPPIYSNSNRESKYAHPNRPI